MRRWTPLDSWLSLACIHWAISVHTADGQSPITTHTHTHTRRGVVVSGVRRMNEVNPRRARLVLGWVTVFGRVYHLGM